MSFKSTKRIMKFQEDFYAMTQIGYLYINEPERSLIIVEGDQNDRKKLFRDPRDPTKETVIDPDELSSHFRTCIFIFLIQMTLIYFSAYKSKNLSEVVVITDDGNEMDVLVVRFMCALALHLQIEGEVL
jgi:hypothetical protein